MKQEYSQKGCLKIFRCSEDAVFKVPQQLQIPGPSSSSLVIPAKGSSSSFDCLLEGDFADACSPELLSLFFSCISFWRCSRSCLSWSFCSGVRMLNICWCDCLRNCCILSRFCSSLSELSLCMALACFIIC